MRRTVAVVAFVAALSSAAALPASADPVCSGNDTEVATPAGLIYVQIVPAHEEDPVANIKVYLESTARSGFNAVAPASGRGWSLTTASTRIPTHSSSRPRVANRPLRWSVLAFCALAAAGGAGCADNENANSENAPQPERTKLTAAEFKVCSSVRMFDALVTVRMNAPVAGSEVSQLDAGKLLNMLDEQRRVVARDIGETSKADDVRPSIREAGTALASQQASLPVRPGVAAERPATETTSTPRIGLAPADASVAEFPGKASWLIEQCALHHNDAAAFVDDPPAN